MPKQDKQHLGLDTEVQLAQCSALLINAAHCWQSYAPAHGTAPSHVSARHTIRPMMIARLLQLTVADCSFSCRCRTPALAPPSLSSCLLVWT